MDRLTTQLIETLEEKKGLLKDLISILEEEEDLLISGEYERLPETTKKKETITLRIKIVEESLGLLSGRMPVDSSGGLNALSRFVPDSEKGRIRDLIGEIRDLALDVIEKNRNNFTYLEDALIITRGAIHLLMGGTLTPGMYSRDGEISDARYSFHSHVV